MKLMPSTITRVLAGSTRSTRPRLPLSRPVRTTTLSFLRTDAARRMVLQHLRRERDDLHEAPLAQLTRHRSEHTRADRLAFVVDDDGGIAIEADVAAVAPPKFLPRAHDHRFDHLALFDRCFRRRFFHRRRDDVADPRVAAGGPADGIDDGDLSRAGVVGDVEDRTHLDHDCSPEFEDLETWGFGDYEGRNLPVLKSSNLPIAKSLSPALRSGSQPSACGG